MKSFGLTCKDAQDRDHRRLKIKDKTANSINQSLYLPISTTEQDAMLSQGEPRDAAISFDTGILHAVTLAQHGFLL